MITGYKEFEKEFFVHGNRGRKPKNALTEEFKTEIELLYTNKYFDCTYTKFKEFLETRENIILSVDEVRVILRDKYIFSPRTHKSTKKKFRKKLENEIKIAKKKASSKVEEDTFTQFAYACKQLGIHIETSSVPEFKPRVERLFQTLQQRIVYHKHKELDYEIMTDIVVNEIINILK